MGRLNLSWTYESQKFYVVKQEFKMWAEIWHYHVNDHHEMLWDEFVFF